MTLPVILLTLRILSAITLLFFLFLITWIAYQDMRNTAQVLADQNKAVGQLRVTANEMGEPPVGTIYPLQAVTRIGRSRANTIVFEDDYVSNEHSIIERRGGHWWLTDLASKNGTLLNDQLLDAPAIISTGDVIIIGGTQLVFEQFPA